MKHTIASLLIIFFFLCMIPICSNTVEASDNKIMKIYITTQYICPDGGIGYKYTEYETYTLTAYHPNPTWVCREVVEDATGFVYEVCEKVHTDHGMTEERVFFVIKKSVGRYHWSCR